MRSWLLMTVVGLGVLAGASSEGRAEAFPELQCNRCTGAQASIQWGSGGPLPRPKSVYACLMCPDSENEGFVQALNGLIASNPSSIAAGEVCNMVNHLIEGSNPALQHYIVSTCNSNALTAAVAGSTATSDAIGAESAEQQMMVTINSGDEGDD